MEERLKNIENRMARIAILLSFAILIGAIGLIIGFSKCTNNGDSVMLLVTWVSIISSMGLLVVASLFEILFIKQYEIDNIDSDVSSTDVDASSTDGDVSSTDV